MRKWALLVTTAALVIVLNGSASPTMITADFTTVPSGDTAGNQGLTLYYGDLTTTATAKADGTAANVYWGGVGYLGIQGLPYSGLRVKKIGQACNPPINFNEGLIFTFAQPVKAKNAVKGGVG